MIVSPREARPKVTEVRVAPAPSRLSRGRPCPRLTDQGSPARLVFRCVGTFTPAAGKLLYVSNFACVLPCLLHPPPMPQPQVQLDRHHRRQRRVLRAVAAFEFCKGVFVFLMGICALLLVHKDLWLYAESLLALFHVSTDRKSAQLFLDFADNITDARLWAAARIAFAYTALRFTEGYGLWKERTWAEWVAFV